jgi:cytochrome c oxidase subunit 3
MFAGAPIVFGVGTIGVLYTMASWWGDVIREAQYRAITPVSCSFIIVTA